MRVLILLLQDGSFFSLSLIPPTQVNTGAFSMRMTAFSPIWLSHTMPFAKPTPSVAEQSKPLAPLQPASGDTFTAVSPPKKKRKIGVG